MIYFLGGASRTGKSKYAKRVAEEMVLKYIALDQERNRLNGRPNHSDEVSPWFYSHLKKFIEEKLDLKSNYILEIDLFYPEQVIELIKSFPVRACFIGSSTMNTDTLRNMRCDTDWHQNMDDIQLENLATTVKDISAKFKQKCEETSFKFIDVFCHENDKLTEIQTALFES